MIINKVEFSRKDKNMQLTNKSKPKPNSKIVILKHELESLRTLINT